MPACRPYLVSAISGGQWTQTRKAKLPGLTHGTKCQLCFSADGTTQHRHVCSTTTPADGWTQPNSKIKQYCSSLSIDRRNALRDRAVHTVSVPIPEPQTNSQGWQWMTDAPQADADNLTWIIDGSRRYAADWTLSTTGFGVAVVDQEETLLAYAYATPPSWVKTASAAEA